MARREWGARRRPVADGYRRRPNQPPSSFGASGVGHGLAARIRVVQPRNRRNGYGSPSCPASSRPRHAPGGSRLASRPHRSIWSPLLGREWLDRAHLPHHGDVGASRRARPGSRDSGKKGTVVGADKCRTGADSRSAGGGAHHDRKPRSSLRFGLRSARNACCDVEHRYDNGDFDDGAGGNDHLSNHLDVVGVGFQVRGKCGGPCY